MVEVNFHLFIIVPLYRHKGLVFVPAALQSCKRFLAGSQGFRLWYREIFRFCWEQSNINGDTTCVFLYDFVIKLPILLIRRCSSSAKNSLLDISLFRVGNITELFLYATNTWSSTA